MAIVDPPKLSVVVEEWWKVKSREVKNPSLLTQFILLFIPHKEVLDPKYRIFYYTEFRGKVYDLYYTGCIRVSSSQYRNLF